MACLIPASEFRSEVVTGRVKQGWADHLTGGKADKRSPEDFESGQLAAGKKVESEHTSAPNVATEIAMDHLAEDPEYYKKLKLIHDDEKKVAFAKQAGALLAHRMTKEALLGAVGKVLGRVAGRPAASVGRLAKGGPAPLRSVAPLKGGPSPLFSSNLKGLPRGGPSPLVPLPGQAQATNGLRRFAPVAQSSKTVAQQAPGKVVPQAKPSSTAATQVGGRVTPAAPTSPSTAPAASPAASGTVKQGTGPKKIGLLRPALLGAAGLGAYGLYKAAPWAAQAIKEEGSMPMAAGGGWSSVPYGYGYSPWGNAAPNMGAF